MNQSRTLTKDQQNILKDWERVNEDYRKANGELFGATKKSLLKALKELNRFINNSFDLDKPMSVKCSTLLLIGVVGLIAVAAGILAMFPSAGV